MAIHGKAKREFFKQRATRVPKAPPLKILPTGRPAYQPGMGREFYLTEEWQKLRFRVLRESDMRCQYCGHDRDDMTIDGRPVKLTVDHKLPRKTHPQLELSRLNLHVLCQDCNTGKGHQIVEIALEQKREY